MTTVYEERDALMRENETLRWLVQQDMPTEAARLCAENERLQSELAEAQASAAMWKTGADNTARLYEGLKRQVEPARKVADAADKYDKVEGSYLKLKKALEVWRNAKPLSPEKQALIEKALDKTDEEWEALASQEVER